MARKKSVIDSLDQAFAVASMRIVNDAIKDLPANMTMGALVDEFAESEYNDHFREMNLGDFVSALGGRRAAPAAGGNAPKRKQRSGGKEFNTRTAEGREALKGKVAETLSDAGSASSEEIRKAIGGTPAQLRQALARLKDEGKVKTTGQKRATVYHWKGRK
jgi:hypothetical protein